MLDIEELSEGNLNTYSPLLGEDFLEDMHREFYRGYGVLEDGTPAGIMVYELINADQFDEFVKSRILLLKASSKEAYALLHEKYKEDGVEDGEISESSYWLKEKESADSCEKAGFSKEEKESEYITMNLKKVSETPFFTKFNKFPEYFCFLKDVSSIQYHLAIKNCLFRGVKGTLEDLGYLKRDWFDNDLSVCTIADDEIDGLFLVRTTATGIIEPVLLHANGPDSQRNLAMMLVYSVNEAAKTRPPETVIRVKRSKNATIALVNKLFPGMKGEELFFGKRDES